jgi:hypothetical protein
MSRSSNGRSRKDGPIFVMVLGMAVVDMLSEWAGFDVARCRASKVIQRVMRGSALRVV